MLKVLMIACQLLRISNEDISYMILHLKEPDIVEIFSGNYDIIFQHNLTKYEAVFKDQDNIKAVVRKARKLHNLNIKYNIKMILLNDEYYPDALRELKKSAPILYIQGHVIDFDGRRLIGCVGTRHPSEFGKNATSYFVEKWVNEGCVIVSGLAKGIDTLSHSISVNNSIQTIAVLAHGLDAIYPKENGGLATKIVDTGGCLISEYPIGTKPEKHHFVNRNRIVAALSDILVVFEAKKNSGTMHTVKFAEELGKPILSTRSQDDT